MVMPKGCFYSIIELNISYLVNVWLLKITLTIMLFLERSEKLVSRTWVVLILSFAALT